MTKEQQLYWKTPEGEQIYVKCLHPEQKPIAVIGIVHGMGEHCHRYFNLEAFLLPQGYAVISFDQIGHGKSSGKRGHVDRYSLLLDNIDRLIEESKQQFPSVPFVLFGHSMGGNLVANYLLTRDTSYIKAAILSSPWFKLAFDPSVITIKIVKALNQLFPNFTQNTKLEINAISRDPDYVQNYYSDPLVHTNVSLRFFNEVYHQGLWNIKHANRLKTKTLLYHGDADRITSYKGSREFYERAMHNGSIDFHVFSGYYHEAHNDLGKEEVYQLLQHFLSVALELNRFA